jgi:hypothetical protein
VSFGTVDTYYLLSILHSDLIQFSFFAQSNVSVHTIVSVPVTFSLTSLFDYFAISTYLIIVLYIVPECDPGDVFQVFQSCYQQPSTESKNVIDIQDPPTSS